MDLKHAGGEALPCFARAEKRQLRVTSPSVFARMGIVRVPRQSAMRGLHAELQCAGLSCTRCTRMSSAP